MALNADQSALAQIAEDINSKLKPDIVFSLERTLSAWMSLGTYMYVTGLGLVNFGQSFPIVIGFILTPVGILWNLWCFWVYYMRLLRLEKRKPLNPSSNRIPIAVFTFIFVATLALTIIFAVIYTATERVGVSTKGEECVSYSTSQVIPLSATSDSTAYVFETVKNSAIELGCIPHCQVRGQTYTFSPPLNQHPFFIKADATTGSTGAYTGPEISGNGLGEAGNLAASLTFTPDATTPNSLHYICSLHDVMTSTIKIVDTAADLNTACVQK